MAKTHRLKTTHVYAKDDGRRFTLAERYAWLLEARDNLAVVFGLGSTATGADTPPLAFLGQMRKARTTIDTHLARLGVDVSGDAIGAVSKKQGEMVMDAASAMGGVDLPNIGTVAPKAASAAKGAAAAAAALGRWGKGAGGKLAAASRGALVAVQAGARSAWGVALLAGKWAFSEAGVIKKALQLAVVALIAALTAKHVFGIDPAHPMSSQWFWIAAIVAAVVIFGGRNKSWQRT